MLDLHCCSSKIKKVTSTIFFSCIDVMDRMGELSGNESTMAKDLCMKMLQYSPDIRMTVDEALAHPYLTTDPVIVQKNGKAEMEVENVKKIDMSYMKRSNVTISNVTIEYGNL